MYIFCRKDYRNWFALVRSGEHLYWQSPPLLQSCWQIREEAKSIYYSGNQFTIVDENSWPHLLRKWLSALDPADVQSLTEVRVHSYQFEPTICLVNDIMDFRKSLQGTDQALSKDVLRMKVMVEKEAPGVTYPRDRGVVETEYLSVARLEKGRIDGDAIVEDDSGELMCLMERL